MEKRGGPFFAALSELGVRVQVIEAQRAGDFEVAIWRPWTFLFANVPLVDFGPYARRLDGASCSVIMDCHFPIMDMEQAIGSNTDLIEIIDNKDQLLANLALADAVTVSQPSWAADLAEVNPNVFVLPDYDQGDGGMTFNVRMAEASNASFRTKMDRRGM